MGVGKRGRPRTAIRENCSIRRAALAELKAKSPKLERVLLELGGDDPSATVLARPAMG